ncbi:hypothetical protein RMS29_012635 [Agrobacterium rosae]|nr:hypothetical protein [Agrobacterium rosae]MCM2432468.1 hypothetical protein [Agrobacterium rosae]
MAALPDDSSDEHVKRSLMPIMCGLIPIMRALIQTVALGKTQGHQPASF